MGGRRQKHWGWGFEDQQPSSAQLRNTAAALQTQLGFASAPPQEPVALEAVRLATPASKRPAALASICTADVHSRASHALGKSYTDVVRGFRGDFEHPPDLVARPREELDVERLLEWCASERVAAIPFGGGTSVVGGVSPSLPAHYNGCDLDRHARAAPRARDRRGLARGMHPGGSARPRARVAARHARTDAAPLPAVVRVLDARRLDRDARGRALRDAVDPHRGLRRVGSRDHPHRRLGVAAAAGIGRRSQPRSDARRLGGDTRRDHPRVGARAAASLAAELRCGALHQLLGGRRCRARDLPGGAAPVQLPPARRR